MKGSTLHRSGLTREKMGVLASLSQADRKVNAKNQLNQYYRNAKAKELDILWGGVQKGIQKEISIAYFFIVIPIFLSTLASFLRAM